MCGIAEGFLVQIPEPFVCTLTLVFVGGKIPEGPIYRVERQIAIQGSA